MSARTEKTPALDVLTTLREHGFKKSARRWWRPNGETTFVVDLQKSQWGNLYYINVGIWLNALGPLPSPASYKCHVNSRLPMYDDLQLALRPDERIEAERLKEGEDPYAWRVRVVRDFMVTKLLPVAEQCRTVYGVRRAIQRGPLNDFKVFPWAYPLVGRIVSAYSFVAVTEPELIRFSTDMGGTVHEEHGLCAGFDSSPGFVTAVNMRSALAGDFKPPAQAVAERLATPVKFALAFYLSETPNSAPHALKLARAFAERWPAAIAGTAEDILTEAELARVLRGDRWSPIRSPDLALLFLAPPEPLSAILALGVTVLPDGDPALLASAETEVRALKDVAYDALRDRIVGFIPAGAARVWVLQDPAPPTVEPWLEPLVSRHLGGPPTSKIRLALGLGASPEAQRVAFEAADRLLGAQFGVVSGTFDFLLDAAGIGEMLDTGRGGLIA